MVSDLRAGEATSGVDVKHAPKQVGAVRRERSWARKVAPENFVSELLLVSSAAVERQMARNHCEQNNTCLGKVVHIGVSS